MRSFLAVLALASTVNAIVDICSLELETGPCRGIERRYGFNAAKGKCVQFIYGGCKGNQNNFKTKQICKKVCGRMDTKEVRRNDVKVNPMLTKKERKEMAKAIKHAYEKIKLKRKLKETFGNNKERKNGRSSAKCMLPITRGNCQAALRRYAFDAGKGKCVPFIYGGCGGNGNNFKTEEKCLKACIANIPASINL